MGLTAKPFLTHFPRQSPSPAELTPFPKVVSPVSGESRSLCNQAKANAKVNVMKMDETGVCERKKTTNPRKLVHGYVFGLVRGEVWENECDYGDKVYFTFEFNRLFATHYRITDLIYLVHVIFECLNWFNHTYGEQTPDE